MRKPQIAAAFTTKCCQSPSLSVAKEATNRKPRSTRSPFPHNAQRNQNESTNHHASKIKKPQRTRKPKNNREERVEPGRSDPASTRHESVQPPSGIDLGFGWIRVPGAIEGDAHRPPLPSSSSSSSAFFTRTIDLRCDDRRPTRPAWVCLSTPNSSSHFSPSQPPRSLLWVVFTYLYL